MKFVHLADCHLGGWNDNALSLLNQESFAQAVDTCIQEDVDFVIIAGDLFDTARPSIDVLDFTGQKLKQLQDHGIQVYVISGSHDYSATGRTMLNVLESVGVLKRIDIGRGSEDGLCLDVTVDEKTGVKLVGMPGRKASLEIEYFQDLDRARLENEDGFKVFVFHSAVEEFRPGFFEKMPGVPVSLFPRGFQYYAGGHVHQCDVFQDDRFGVFGFPGALFPNNFRELERYHHGSFFLITVEDDEVKVDKREVDLAPVVVLSFDAQNKTPESVSLEMKEQVKASDVSDAVVLIRVEGVLSSGRVTEIDVHMVKKLLKENGARTIRVNTAKLSTREYEEINIEQSSSKEELEDMLIRENAAGHELLDYSVEQRVKLTKELFHVLSSEQLEGERKKDYEARMLFDAASVMGVKQLLEELDED